MRFSHLNSVSLFRKQGIKAVIYICQGDDTFKFPQSFIYLLDFYFFSTFRIIFLEALELFPIKRRRKV